MAAEICKYCNRPVQVAQQVDPPTTSHWAAAYATVNHEGYGCDTGCCGYRFVTYDKRNNRLHTKFSFDHPYWYDYDPSNVHGQTEAEYNKLWAEEEVRNLFGDVQINWARSDVKNSIDC